MVLGISHYLKSHICFLVQHSTLLMESTLWINGNTMTSHAATCSAVGCWSVHPVPHAHPIMENHGNLFLIWKKRTLNWFNPPIIQTPLKYPALHSDPLGSSLKIGHKNIPQFQWINVDKFAPCFLHFSMAIWTTMDHPWFQSRFTDSGSPSPDPLSTDRLMELSCSDGCWKMGWVYGYWKWFEVGNIKISWNIVKWIYTIYVDLCS